MLRSAVTVTNTNAVKALRQTAQVTLAGMIAALLVAVSIGGTLLAWRADAAAGFSAQKVAVALLGEARVQKRAEFLAAVRENLDGSSIRSGTSQQMAPDISAATLSSRQHDISLFIITEERELIAAETGLRLSGSSDANIARNMANVVQFNLANINLERPIEYLLSDNEKAAYVFVEPVSAGRKTRVQPNSDQPVLGKIVSGHSEVKALAVGIWFLDIETLAPLFTEHGLLGMQMLARAPSDKGFTSIRLGEENLGTNVYLSWTTANAVTTQWMQLLPLISLALIGVLFAIIKSLRFSRKAAGLVHAIETAAYDRATRDPLTGLHNRSGFKMRLDHALENKADTDLVGVIYIDLDRFKEVNDGFGHETGDKLLMAVTERLTHFCGQNVTIARIGGDEFAVIATKRSSAETIVAIGETISRELGRPFLLGTTEVVIGGSVGVAIAPEDGNDATELVRRADISMYRAKTGGRGQAIRFHASMEDDIKRRKMLEGELRHAIARNQMKIWYQPYMASDGETLIGVEALMRWDHPTEGTISPGLFIPLAEETGQIVEIGEWAMRQALQDGMRWPGLQIAINVSPAQFRRKELVQSTVAMIEEIGIERDRVEIEITEGVLMEDAEAAIEIIQGFRNEKLHVALDDFGTGYASLSYLRRFPFDKLKVDQAFVRNLGVTPGSAAIIHSVVALGRSLGMTVHAEGVETLEHHIFLRAAGCHHFQGYYFSKPMNRDATDIFVASKSIGSLYSRRA